MKIELYKTSDTEKTLKTAREKHTHYAQISKKMTAHFSLEIMLSRETVEMQL